MNSRFIAKRPRSGTLALAVGIENSIDCRPNIFSNGYNRAGPDARTEKGKTARQLPTSPTDTKRLSKAFARQRTFAKTLSARASKNPFCWRSPTSFRSILLPGGFRPLPNDKGDLYSGVSQSTPSPFPRIVSISRLLSRRSLRRACRQDGSAVATPFLCCWGSTLE